MPSTDALLQEIDAAAFDDSRFDTLIAAMAEVVGAQTATLWLLDPPSSGVPPILAAHRIRPGAIEEFGHYWHMLDPWTRRATDRGGMPSGLTAIGSELVDRAELERSPFYNEWAREHGMHAMLASVVVASPEPGGAPRSLACFYRPRGSDEFSARDKAALTALLPRIQATIRLRDQWHAARRLAASAQDAFDQLDAAAFVLDAQKRILHANRIAAALLSDGTEVDHRAARLLGLGARHAPRLDDAVAAALATKIAQAMVVQWAGPPAALCRARVVPLDAPATPAERRREEQVLLIAERPSADRWLALAAQLYGLTAAEARVVAMLASGSEPQAIAERANLRLTTVRTHLRHAMTKLGVARAADVVRLLAGLRP